MKTLCKIVGLNIILLMNMLTFTHSQEVWVGKDGKIRNIDTRALLIDRGEFYLATRNEVYKAKDVDGSWESIFSLPKGATNEINCLACISKNIFVGTKRGLYRSRDYGITWRNVFRAISPGKSHILSIETSKTHEPRKVLIGTRAGIFISEDLGDRWQEITYNLKHTPVKCLAINKGSIYAGGDSGLYTKRDGQAGWERLLVRSAIEDKSEEDIDDSKGLEEKEDIGISCVAIKDDRIYIGMDKKILYSDDNGKSWANLSYEGLGGAVNYILPSSRSDKLFCATTKGAFEFAKDKSKWLELYKGMDKALNVNNIRFDGPEERHLWALTNKGTYRLESARYAIDQYADIEKSLKTLKVRFDSEPTFQELQQAAIRFAEVSPEKIENWRREARLGALFPKVSFGLNNRRATNSEIYTSATKDYIIVGPDDISKSWDMSISWELADLIWSDDQTNIDVRSRLMVQLRNDILDDLRRAYYERKRIQFELMTEPPKDLKTLFEKEMRLAELTSAIDDLTGNYLSRSIRGSER